VETWYPPLNESARPIGRPLLALSDIHGDLTALDAILAHLSGVEFCGILSAGDHCFDGPEPFGVWQRLHELGATLIRGETDLALGTLRPDRLVARSPIEALRLESFVRTQASLGDVICRRLAELPSTAVVSMDHRTGVMATHGSPADEWRSLTPDMCVQELEHEVGCAAEDVLVVGRSHLGFTRKVGTLLLVNAGSVGQSETRTARGQRTAHAVLVQEFSDGVPRARALDVAVPARARKPRGVRRRAG
jgi:predicted phosphodiesterase